MYRYNKGHMLANISSQPARDGVVRHGFVRDGFETPNFKVKHLRTCVVSDGSGLPVCDHYGAALPRFRCNKMSVSAVKRCD